MATITATTETKVFPIESWRGLNEAPDGDTKLRYGDAVIMRNWRVTKDGNLQRRPGNSTIRGLLQGYRLHSGDVCTVKTDRGRSGTLSLWEHCEAGFDGFPELSGRNVTVNSENFSDYAGWYWRRGTYRYYQVLTLLHDTETDVYTWQGREITLEPDTECPDCAVAGIWSGELHGTETVLAACNGRLWSLFDADTQSWMKREVGELDTSGTVTFFVFDGMLYMLNGKEYYQYDGEEFREVHGYRPLIMISAVPDGGGTLLEEINKLTPERRVWFSPDGTATEFQLPEKDLLSIDYCMTTADGEYIDPDSYECDFQNGTVTFTAAPDEGVNTIEIGYSAAATWRKQVTAMRFAETFLGATDNALFLYGDGSNEALYSGLDHDGHPRADYFPDLNEMAVGDKSAPLTQLIKHQSKLLAFKTDSAWSVSYGLITLADNSTEYGFYLTPINRAIGCKYPGSVQQILNNPWTIHGKQLYEWKATGYYSANISADERTAKRISDRIFATLGEFCESGLPVYTFDDNEEQEYYICCGDRALVCNYQAGGAWYEYTAFGAVCMTRFAGHIIYGTADGRVECLSAKYKTSDGHAIESYWESGSMDFGRPYQRKYSAEIWVGVKPEANGSVDVTVQTDRKSEYTEKTVNSDLASFSRMNFARFSFKTNRKPHEQKLKIKAKKFVFYKLIFKTVEADTTATVLNADIRVRYTGDAK